MSIAVTFGMVSTHEGITKPSVFALVVIDARLDHSVRKVVELRSKSNLGSLFMLPDGNDALPLPETGKLARAITRVDYKVMSNVAITKQTPAMAWDARRRHTNDEGGFAAVMNDVARTRTAGIVPTMRVA